MGGTTKIKPSSLILGPCISNAPFTSCHPLISALLTLNCSDALFLLPLTLFWFIMVCLWETLYVVCGKSFKHMWATFPTGHWNPVNNNCLILYFHNGAYNDPGARHYVICSSSKAYLTHCTCSSIITMIIFLMSPTLTLDFYLVTIYLLLVERLIASNLVMECPFSN